MHRNPIFAGVDPARFHDLETLLAELADVDRRLAANAQRLLELQADPQPQPRRAKLEPEPEALVLREAA